MTTVQSTLRPQSTGQPRPGPVATPGATIDPLRLIRQHKFALFVATALGLGLGVGAYYFFLKYSPSYRASVQYIALSPQGLITETKQQPVESAELERFMQTEVRILTSERLLKDASSDARLVTDQRLEWAKQFQAKGGGSALDLAASVRDLKDRASARVIAGTQLIELGVSAPTAADAQMLANALHKAYWDDLGVRLKLQSTEQRDQLERSKRDITTELGNIDTQMNDLISSKQLESSARGQSTDVQEVTLLQNTKVQLEGSLQRFTKDVERMQLQAASETGQIDFGPDLREEADRDSLVVSLKADIAQLNTIKAAKLGGGNMGPNHPDIKKIDSSIIAKEEERKKAIDAALLRIFNARLEQSKQVRDSVAKQLADVTRQITDLKTRLMQVTQAEKDLENLKNRKGERTLKLQEINSTLEAIISQEAMAKEGRRGRIRLADSPSLPDTVYFPRLSYMLAFGLVLSLGLTAGVIVLREVIDQRIKGPSDITIMPRMRLLGMVPTAADDPSRPGAPETAFRDSASGAIAESFRQMRPAIIKRMQQAGHKSLLIGGAMPGSGSTTVAANLAMCCAAADQKVLLIDANFRRPGLHKVFKLGEGPGLGDVLCRKASLTEAVQQTSVPNLHLLSSGTAAARSVPERLATEAMTQVIQDAVSAYDLVIVDTAPMMVAGDGLALANRCDAVLLVVRAMAEKRGLIARIRDQLGESKGEFLGAVINAVRASAGGYMKRNIRASYEYQNNGTTV